MVSAEHACHLAVVHGLFFARLDHMLAVPAPIIKPYDPGSQEPDDRLLQMDLGDALVQFADETVFDFSHRSILDFCFRLAFEKRR
jgi:hypothetical protein